MKHQKLGCLALVWVAMLAAGAISAASAATATTATTSTATTTTTTNPAPPSGNIDAWIAHGISLLRQGSVAASVEVLQQAVARAGTDNERHNASAALGAALTQARRPAEAKAQLMTAHALSGGAVRARHALALAALSTPEQAFGYNTEAQRLALDDTFIRISAELNLARLTKAQPDLAELTGLTEAPAMPLAKLKALALDIERSGGMSGLQRASLYLNLGEQAQEASRAAGTVADNSALALSYHSLEQARLLAGTDAGRLQIEVLDALSGLYEENRRPAEALALTQSALAAMTQLPAGAMGAVGDLVIELEWRQGRLQQTLGKPNAALAAYQRATAQLEQLRLDIPIVLESGDTSYNKLFLPLYTGYMDALLRVAASQPGAEQADYLRRAVDTAELLKQSELQDYLGDRCAVDAVKGGMVGVLADKTAILYPLIFPDRVELLLETRQGIARFSSPVAGALVRNEAAVFANELRNNKRGFLKRSQLLYDWLLRPAAAFLEDRQIDTVVVIPDGALRLVPMGALHDGKRYAIEQFAISTSTGLSMTNTASPSGGNLAALVAGAARFGSAADQFLKSASGQRFSRNIDEKLSRRARGNEASQSFEPEALMRQELALPRVTEEIQAVSKILKGDTIQDEGFTNDTFGRAIKSGKYRIVHVASHAFFGGAVDLSFVMTHDNLLRDDTLQALLKAGQTRQSIDLLSLSACETAAGNERAPLGIAGTAIKTRAKSVLAALWPVDDEVVAGKLMAKFYSGITQLHLSKTEALRQAQLALIKDKAFSKPAFWAPFTLIGNWL